MIESSRSYELVYVHVKELLLTSHGVYDFGKTERTWFLSYTRHFWLRQKPTRHLQASQLHTCQICEKQQSVPSGQSNLFELCEQLRKNQIVSFISLERSTSLVFRTFCGSSISILTKKLWLFQCVKVILRGNFYAFSGLQLFVASFNPSKWFKQNYLLAYLLLVVMSHRDIECFADSGTIHNILRNHVEL